MMTLFELAEFLEDILSRSGREVILKNLPVVIYEGVRGSIWILENGKIWVGEWDEEREEWGSIPVDEELSLMREGLLKLGIECQFDKLVRGKIRSE